MSFNKHRQEFMRKMKDRDERTEKVGIVEMIMQREKEKMNLFIDGSVGEGHRSGGAASVYITELERW